jgi:hypothetical protein
MKIMGRDPPAKTDASSASSAAAADVSIEELPDEAATDLAKDELAQQLGNLGLGLEAPQGAKDQAYLLCADEIPTAAQVGAADGVMRVRYAADAGKCPAHWTKEELAASSGRGRYMFDLWCDEGPAKAAAGLPATRLLRETFVANGELETACMDAAGGKGRYRVASSRRYEMSFKKASLPVVTSASTLHVDRGDGEPCEIAHPAKGAYVIAACRYDLRSIEDYASPADGKAKHVVLKAAMAAHNLVAQAGDRFYSGGTIDLTLNNWKGTIEFKNGAVAPEAELSNGRDVVRVRINGNSTELLP